MRCASHADSTKVKYPAGGIVNVSLADPATMYFDANAGYLRSKETESWVFGTLVGETTHFSNGSIKQICVKPFAHGWHRFMAVVAAVSGSKMFHVQSFKGGVTFGSPRYAIAPEKKPKKVYAAPVEGPGLPKGANGGLTQNVFTKKKLIDLLVPVFDGREVLQVGKYWDKEYEGEVLKGSTVMVLFSTKKGELPKAMQGIKNPPKGVEFSFYFNILGVVILTGPSKQFSESPSSEKPKAFGVDNLQTWGVVADETSEGEEEKAVEEIDEPVL